MIAHYKWAGLAAAVIGLVVRLLKEDVRFMPTIPGRFRPWIAIALGLVSSVLLHLEPGVSWSDAVIAGLSAGVAAIVGHELVIESVRKGREVGAAAPASSTSSFPDEQPTKKEGRSIPPLPVLLVIALALVGCHTMTPAEKAAAADAAYKAAIVACATGAKTRAEGEACIADVDRQWTVPTLDAGADR